MPERWQGSDAENRYLRGLRDQRKRGRRALGWKDSIEPAVDPFSGSEIVTRFNRVETRGCACPRQRVISEPLALTVRFRIFSRSSGELGEELARASARSLWPSAVESELAAAVERSLKFSNSNASASPSRWRGGAGGKCGPPRSPLCGWLPVRADNRALGRQMACR